MQMIGLSSGRLWISLGSRQSMLHVYWSYREDKNPTHGVFLKKKRKKGVIRDQFHFSKPAKKKVATTAGAFVCKQGRLPLEGPSLVTVPRSPVFNFNNHLVLDLEGDFRCCEGFFPRHHGSGSGLDSLWVLRPEFLSLTRTWPTGPTLTMEEGWRK